jgi:hypothetical protein
MNLEIPGTQLKVSKSSLFSISARIATLILPFLSCSRFSRPSAICANLRTLSLATLLNPVVFASVYFKNYSERANLKSSCPITMGNFHVDSLQMKQSLSILYELARRRTNIYELARRRTNI